MKQKYLIPPSKTLRVATEVKMFLRIIFTLQKNQININVKSKIKFQKQIEDVHIHIK